MSINRSLYIGLSGMNANSTALNVIGDNIANMNTIGFKAGRSSFQEMLGQSVMGSGGPSMIGGGVGVAGVQKMFEQGSLLGTGGEWDLAVGGEGFFPMQGEVDGVSGMFYSRNGQMSKDNEGFITNPQGLKLMGYPADSTGAIQSNLTTLKIDDSPIPPEPTTKIDMSLNLDARLDVFQAGDPPADIPFDPADPGKSSQFQSSVTVYDKQGIAHDVDVYWSKSGENTWKYNVMVSGTGSTQPVVPDGTVEFTSDGKLVSLPDISIDFAGPGGESQSIKLNIEGTTQFGERSSLTGLDQDGSQAGTFQNVNIDTDGKVVGTFSNGEEKVLGQIALARFKSNDGLRSVGGGMFAGSMDSGSVIIGAANTGGRGQIVAGALEQSTVDIATEFTNMIVAQRGYQANSRTISTADQIMQEAVNLKR